jgi:hypothetical protein
MTAVLHLLSKTSYQKYVRFFSGMLLVVILVTPALEFIFDEGFLVNRVSYENFWQEMDNIHLDIDKLEEDQKRILMSKYEKAVADDVTLFANQEDFYVNGVEVMLKEDYSVERLELHLSLTEQGGITIEKITLADNSQEYPQVLQLKEDLMLFYQVGNDQIQIIVEG